MINLDESRCDTIVFSSEVLLFLEPLLADRNIVVVKKTGKLNLPLYLQEITIKDVKLVPGLSQAWCFVHKETWHAYSNQEGKDKDFISDTVNKALCSAFPGLITETQFRFPTCVKCQDVIYERNKTKEIRGEEREALGERGWFGREKKEEV